MTAKRTKLSIVALTVAISSPTLAADQCATRAEMHAEHVRIIQTEFMIAALKCSQAELGLFDKYNSIVKKFTPQLIEHSDRLTGYFKRHYETAYRRHMDKYITAIANNVSMASDLDSHFCAISAQRADIILYTRTESTPLASLLPYHPQLAQLDCPPANEETITAENLTAASNE